MNSNSSPSTPQPVQRRRGRTVACTVRMLDDTVEVFHVPVKSTGQVLFNEVVQKLNLLESDYFDLQYGDVRGNLCWLDREKPIIRQLPRHKVDLQFVVKFYTPDPGLLEDELTRYLFALQVKRDLASGNLPCHEHTAILLASYVVQAECGDYVEEEFGIGPGYLKALKLLPHQNDEIEAKVMGHHREHFGLSPADADLGLLDVARKMEHYGLRMYPAKDHEGVSLHLSVAHLGVIVFQSLIRINTFSWAKIRKLSFRRKKLLIKLHPEGYGFYKDTIEFYFDSRDSCKNFWKFCIEHHAFFRCHTIRRLRRQQSGLISRGSSFRYCGRTQKQLVEYVRENFIKRPAFPRSTSSRTVSLGRSSGASPRTGTLNSQDLHVSQMTNVSSGSHIISFSPPPSVMQNNKLLPGSCLSPTLSSNAASISSSIQLSPVAAPVVIFEPMIEQSVIGRLVNGHTTAEAGGVDPTRFQLSVTMPTYSSGDLQPPIALTTESSSSVVKLPRSPELENMPTKLNDGRFSLKRHSSSQSTETPEPPPAYTPFGIPQFSIDSPTAMSIVVSTHSTPVISYRGKSHRSTDAAISTFSAGSAAFTSDGSLASSVVAVADDDGRPKMKPVSKAFYIVKELLMTERTYRKDLEIINKSFRNAVGKDGVAADSLNELLFGLINPLFDFHCIFLKQIEQRLAIWEAKSNTQMTGDSRQISDVLLMLMSVLPRYQNYLDHEEELFIALDSECKENRVFDRLYREFEMQKVCYLPINSFLLKPPQRLLHYQLILNKLLQEFTKTHPLDYADCQELLIRIGELTRSFQDGMRRAEMLQKLIELQQDLVGVEDLVQPSRVFIREGCLQKLSSKGYQQRMFFLFSDMLVYASRMPTRSLQFKVHGCLNLLNMAVKETDHQVAAANSFTIYAGNRLLVVAASSENEKNKWVEDLEAALENSASTVNKVEASKVLYPSLKSNSSSEVADDTEADYSVDRQIQHRTNTLMHVCWHRNTSVSMVERSIAVRHLLSGYLLRKFKSGSGWQKLWVVFTNFCLFFYKSHQDDFPLASLPLLGYAVLLPSPEDGIHKDFVFKLQFKNHVYLFRAESQYTFERWMEVITLATSKSRHMRLFSRMESVNQAEDVVT